jgi:hypothetical protein
VGGVAAEVSVPEETRGLKLADSICSMPRGRSSGAGAARPPSLFYDCGPLKPSRPGRMWIALGHPRSKPTEGRRPARMPAAKESTAFPRLIAGQDARDGT